MLDALRRGDRVVTGGGIIGTGQQGRRQRGGRRSRSPRACASACCAARSPASWPSPSRSRRARRARTRTAGEAPTKRRRKHRTKKRLMRRTMPRRASAPGVARCSISPDGRCSLICGVCVLGVLFALPNLFPPAQLGASGRAGCRTSRSASASICAAAPICCSQVDVAAAQREQLNSIVDNVRDALRTAPRSATPGSRSRATRSSSPSRDTDQIEPAQGGARQDRSRSLTVDIGPDGAGKIQFSATGNRGAAQPGGRAVDRDRAPPHRRDRHQGADDPAPGPGPHPGRSCPASTIPSTSRSCSARPRR